MTDDGASVAVPAGRPRTLLAALALRPRVVIGLQVLQRYLWPEQLPENPRRALQTYAARLRSALGTDVVHSTADGLAFAAPREAVDLFRFRAAVEAAAKGDPAEELAGLRQALTLWRGMPLEGLVPDELASEHGLAVLEELIGAAERANELALQLNQIDDELIGSLRRLTVQHPWRETLWSQLMLALYRRGRSGEALATFHELVGVLRGDLGLDPGPELSKLHQRMLAADPSLLPETAGPAVESSVPRPAQLPPDISDFVGRDAALAAMTELLSADAVRGRRAVISGPAGTGKTTLAVHVAHRVRSAFGGGQLFTNLRGTTDSASALDVLGSFLRALGLSGSAIPDTLEERSALFRSTCAERGVLVLLDNAESSEQVAPLLPGDSGCAVIITSRPQLSATPADLRLDLTMLSGDEARELLTMVVGAGWLATEPDATEVVLRACAGSPLAIRIAGGRLVTRPTWPVGELAAQLTSGNALDVLALDGVSVRGALDVSYHGMDAELARRFRLLAAAPVTTTRADVAAILWHSDQRSARASLEELCDLRLLEPVSAEVYRWHDLVGEYLTDLAEHDELVRPSRRLLHQVRLSLRNAKLCLRPEGDVLDAPDIGAGCGDPTAELGIGEGEIPVFTDPKDVHDWLHPRFESIMVLARQGLAGQRGMPVPEAAAVMMLADLVADECCLTGTFGDASREVLAAGVPEPAGLAAIGVAWHQLGWVLGAQRRFDEAFHAGAKAMEIWRELGHEFREMFLLQHMAAWYWLSGRYDDAAALYSTCIDADDVLSPQLRARCLQNLASVYVKLGRSHEAEQCLKQASSLSPPEPVSRDAHHEALRWGQIHRLAGRFGPALEAYERCESIADQLASSYMRAYALIGKATTLRRFGADGSLPAARALEVARANGHPYAEAQALVELGHFAMTLRDHHLAASYWQAALNVLESMNATDTDDVRELLNQVA